MKRLLVLLFSLLFLLSACGAPAMATEAPAAPTDAPAATEAPVVATAEPDLPNLPFFVTLTPGKSLIQQPNATSAPAATEPPALPSSPLATPTHLATSIPFTANPTFTSEPSTPTETLLPALELPTERANAPALVAWTGLPTYLGDSDPGLLFRVDYDPDLWAQTEGNFGDIVLGNRQMPYCTVTPWSGRGLPADWKVTHDFRYIGSASFDVNTVTYQGIVKFVSYVGGDGHVLTGFQVSFNEQKDECLLAAEAILGTLRSFAAVPTLTPTTLPETSTPPASAGRTASTTPTP